MDPLEDLINTLTNTLANNIGPKLLTWAGALWVVVMIWVGIKYITGGVKGTETAKNALMAALIGLVIIAAAWAIINFVANRIIVIPPA